MKYKHTVQIITKDIQDIEKLVDNFNNYSSIPAIELDLALSKLRNIYDLLLMFKESANELSLTEPEYISDNNIENAGKNQNPVTETLVREESLDKAGQFQAEENVIPPADNNIIHQDEPEVESEMKLKVKPEIETKAEAEEESVQENTDNPTSEETKSDATSGEIDSFEIEEDNHEPDHREVVFEETTHKIPEESPLQEIKTRNDSATLGQRYKSENKYINDRFGEQTITSDLKSKLQGTPITSISGSIGINDKFYFIRELFKGNPENFRQTMETLDHSPNFNEAYNYLMVNYNWEMESEPVQQLLSLIRRKFISQGHE